VTDRQDSHRLLAVHIDNDSEWPTLRAARRVLHAVTASGLADRRGWLVGLYPIERLIVTDESGRRTDPYFHDPGRHAVDPRRQLVDLRETVEALYALTTTMAASPLVG
jgi:hypothetical protein